MKAFEEELRELVRAVVREELAAARLSDPSHDEFLSPRAAARVADVAPATVRRWVREGKLRKHHAGAHVRVSRAELEALLATPIRRAVDPANDFDESIRSVIRSRISKRSA